VTPTDERARRVALDVLVRVERGAFSHVLLPEVLRRASLPARDRAFATDLVYGTIRGRRLLDHLLAPVSAKPLHALDPDVRAALRLGAHQLLGGVPPHAAVGETVAVAPARARGYVNGVLRSLARRGPPFPLPAGDDVTSLGVRTSHPDWIVERLVREHGRDAATATLHAANAAPAVTLRVRPGRATPESVETELHESGATVTRGALLPDSLVVRGTGDPAALPAVRDGRATPQDQASQAVAGLVGARPGERVLDLCAAPGGKATALAEALGGDGVVVAADLRRGRLALVARAAQRLGLDALVSVVADAGAPPWRDAAFDRVLLDAPCSGLGVLRRRAEARWRVRPGDVAGLAALQRRLLTSAARLVVPGGRLVYAVCTTTEEETLGVDDHAARALPGFHALDAPAPPWRAHGRGGLLLPGDAGTDGMFVLRLERAVDEATASLAER
jgi:16S rRNA (cytosine967-C5)-methyltransferase